MKLTEKKSVYADCVCMLLQKNRPTENYFLLRGQTIKNEQEVTVNQMKDLTDFCCFVLCVCVWCVCVKYFRRDQFFKKSGLGK